MLRQVLIIDDHDSDLLFSSLMVEHAKVAATVTTFEDATEALRYLQQPAGQSVDLIFLDINMPRMNGMEFLAAFEKLRLGAASPAVVVMLTSSPDPRDREHAMAFASVRDYVIKPVDAEQVKQVVNRVFGPVHRAPDGHG